MFIRFEVAGQGLWAARWDVAASANRAWKWPPWASRVRRMNPDAQDEYRNLMDELVSGIKSPPGAMYAPEPGRRCITFFRMAGPTQEQVLAGWKLITILRAHGWPAYEVFAHTPPGRVTYQDDHQIVVAVRAKRSRSEHRGWNGDRTTIRGRGAAGNDWQGVLPALRQHATDTLEREDHASPKREACRTSWAGGWASVSQHVR